MSRLVNKLRTWQDSSRAENTRGPPFQYKPLEGEDTFRLLKLPSTPGEPCQLQHFPLHDCPKYTALSYTWQSPLLTDKSIARYRNIRVSLIIETGGVTAILPIFKSLDEALRGIIAVRASGVLNIPDYIWADGICINQENVKERNRQVPLMDRIYSNCEIVLVWLGKDETDLDGFLSIHELLEPIIRERKSPDSTVARALPSAWTLQDLESVLGRQIHPRTWTAYISFYERRRWFSRVWVAQEVALPRETVILCGDKTFSWDTIRVVKDFLRESLAVDLQKLRSVHYERPAGYEIATMSRLRNFAIVFRNSTASKKFADIYPLLHDRTGATTDRELGHAVLHECLTTVRSLESECKHDKVYGVIGIFSKICGQNIDDLLRPDYDLMVQEVFTRVTWLLLRELPNLSVLSSVEDASVRRLERMPSWVPDWTSAISNSSLASMLSPRSNASQVAERYQGYRELESSSLILRGSVFDTVAAVAENPQISNARDMNVKIKGAIISLESAFELCMDGKSPVRSNQGQSTWEMLWRTMIADRTSDDFPITADYFICYILEVIALHKARFGADKMYKRTLLRLQKFKEMNDIQQPREGTIGYLADLHKKGVRLAKAAAIEKDYTSFLTVSGEIMLRRRLFRTGEGHLGLGPLSMKIYDQIWLMDGAHYPFLLRPTADGNSFTFVGDLYLHGHMNGEMLRDDLRGRFRPVTLK